MLAIPVRQNRIAPVFNWCTTILLVSKSEGECGRPRELLITNRNTFDVLKTLKGMGVSTVICGAISPELLRYSSHLDMEIIHGLAGAVEEIVHAYHARELDQPAYRLPGCRPRCCASPGQRSGQSCDSTQPSSSDLGAYELQKGAIEDNGQARKSQWSKRERREVMPGSQKGSGGGQRQSGKGGGGACARGQGAMGRNREDLCVCPRCGKELPHTRGVPCTQISCPACQLPLVRK
jgi:hypothetical protein